MQECELTERVDEELPVEFDAERGLGDRVSGIVEAGRDALDEVEEVAGMTLASQFGLCRVSKSIGRELAQRLQQVVLTGIGVIDDEGAVDHAQDALDHIDPGDFFRCGQVERRREHRQAAIGDLLVGGEQVVRPP